MSRTFNRAPVTVNTPSASDIKTYFFNQVNWKGVSDNKNVTSVDQETFEDADNVFVDFDGLLKSRPAIHSDTITVISDGNATQLRNILDVWTFDKVRAYQSEVENSDNSILTFVNENFDEAVQVQLLDKNVRLIFSDNKIFVFTKYSFDYYDVKSNEYNNATDFIHIPVKSVLFNDVESNKETVESENELSSSYITKYIYDTATYSDIENLINNKFSFTLDGVTYSILFTKASSLIFLKKYSNVSPSNFSVGNKLGDFSEGLPLIEVSQIGRILMSSYSAGEYTIRYTDDGVTFVTLPTIDGILGKPLISDDGTKCIVFRKNGPYVFNLNEPSSWTNLVKSINNDFYNELNINVTAAIQNGHFVDDRTFAFTYGDAKDDRGRYCDFYCVTCNNGVLEKHEVFRQPYSVDVTFTGSLTKTVLFNRVSPPTSTLVNYQYDPVEPNITLKYKSNNSSVQNKTISMTISYYGIDYNITNNAGSGSVSVTAREFPSGKITTHSYPFEIYGYTCPEWITTFTTDDYSFTVKSSAFSITGGGAPELEIQLNAISETVNFNGKEIEFTVEDYDDYLSYYVCLDTYMPTIYYDIPHDTFFIRFVCMEVNDDTPWHMLYISKDDLCILLKAQEQSHRISSPLRSDFIVSYVDNKYEIASAICEKLPNNTCKFYTAKYVRNDMYITNEISDGFDGDFDTFKVKINPVNKYVLTNERLYDNYTKDAIQTKLLFSSIPIAYFNNEIGSMYTVDEQFLYKNSTVLLHRDVVTDGIVNYIVPDAYVKANEYYFSLNNTLYISSTALDYTIKDGELVTSKNSTKWYFPKINTQTFDKDITNLHMISKNTIAIFFDTYVQYVSRDDEVKAYRYYETKIPVGCRKESDILTTYDGKYIIFASDRGLVAMTEQQFISSDEQQLSYISDTIHSVFKKYFNNSQVKLFKYDYWIFVYKVDDSRLLVFDTRNNSWWPMSYSKNIRKIVNLNNSINFIVDGSLCSFKTSGEYTDDINGDAEAISWKILSQKLHLNAPNYYKHIYNICISSVHENEDDLQNVTFKLQTCQYRSRKYGNIDSPIDYLSLDYDVDAVRTFVQRLNYIKVNEFQYQLFSNDNLDISIPLCLNSISVKYKICDQVR